MEVVVTIKTLRHIPSRVVIRSVSSESEIAIHEREKNSQRRLTDDCKEAVTKKFVSAKIIANKSVSRFVKMIFRVTFLQLGVIIAIVYPAASGFLDSNPRGIRLCGPADKELLPNDEAREGSIESPWLDFRKFLTDRKSVV